MLYIISTVHVFICLFLILVVLLQQGSGADLSVFGGGGTQTAFGARSATNLLHKLTVAGFVGFILTTIAIGFLRTGGSSGSVMSGVDQSAPAAQLEEASEAPVSEGEAPEAATAPVESGAEAGAGPTPAGDDAGSTSESVSSEEPSEP